MYASVSAWNSINFCACESSPMNLSGWVLTDFRRKAFVISLVVAVFSTPTTSYRLLPWLGMPGSRWRPTQAPALAPDSVVELGAPLNVEATGSRYPRARLREGGLEGLPHALGSLCGW